MSGRAEWQIFSRRMQPWSSAARIMDEEKRQHSAAIRLRTAALHPRTHKTRSPAPCEPAKPPPPATFQRPLQKTPGHSLATWRMGIISQKGGVCAFATHRNLSVCTHPHSSRVGPRHQPRNRSSRAALDKDRCRHLSIVKLVVRSADSGSPGCWQCSVVVEF